MPIQTLRDISARRRKTAERTSEKSQTWKRDQGPNGHDPVRRDAPLTQLLPAMRILFISHYFPPEGNAPASRVHEMCKRWVRAGHDVTVITCAPNSPNGVVYSGYRNRIFQRETVDGIKVHRVWTYVA